MEILKEGRDEGHEECAKKYDELMRATAAKLKTASVKNHYHTTASEASYVTGERLAICRVVHRCEPHRPNAWRTVGLGAIVLQSLSVLVFFSSCHELAYFCFKQ